MESATTENKLSISNPSVQIVPNGLELLPFQNEAVQKMLDFLRKCKCCYNACEQGLGKSIQTVAVLNYVRSKHPSLKTLIICPKSMIYTWGEEVAKWSTLRARDANNPDDNWKHSVRIKVIDSGRQLQLIDKQTKDPLYDVCITSYSLLTSNVTVKLALTPLDFDFLVLDEVFYLKNRKAQRTETVLKQFWPKATYKIALAGTVFTQSVLDAYTIFSKMSPEDFPSWWNFVNRFAVLKKGYFGDKYEGVKNSDVLSKIIRNKFFVRYLKKDVLPQLPPKRWAKIILGTEYNVKILDRDKEDLTRQEFVKYMESVNDGKSPIVPKYLAEYRRLQGIAKVIPVVEFVEDLLEQRIPVVLFAYHREVLAQYKERFKKWNPSVITGDTSALARKEAIANFQGETPDAEDRKSNGVKTNLFIGQLEAAGVGITLTRSSNVVYGEFDWSPAKIAQSADRCHRIGQLDSVTCYYFVVKDSIDEQLVATVIRKAKDFAKVTDIEHHE